MAQGEGIALEEFLTVRQAAEELGVTTETLYKAIRQGRLPASSIMERVAIRRADVEAYKERQARVGPQGGRPRKVRRPVGRPRKEKEQTP